MTIAARLLITAVAGFCTAANAVESTSLDAGADNRMGLTFTPDGKTAFWVEWDGTWGAADNSHRVIFTAQQENGAWGPARRMPFTSQYSDDDPFVSLDGEWLYFASERPLDDSDKNHDANIWRYHLVDGGPPEYLAINSPSADFSPVTSSSGALYFASDREGGFGQGDIYRAARIGDDFAPPENLGATVNSPGGEWNLWISADESDLLFEASSRPTNVSRSGDLYYTWRTAAGWAAAVPVAPLNTAGSDLMPRLHPDGKTLYFTTAPFGGHARIATADWPALRGRLQATYAPALVVANRSSHELTFVDLASGEVTARIATGEGPHLISNVSNGLLLATGYGEFPRPHAEPVARRPPFVVQSNSRLTVIDAENRNVKLDAVIDDCARPHASWIVEDRAWVTCETEQQLVVLDLASADTVRRIDTRQHGSHVLGFEPASNTMAVSNTESASVSLIDVDSGATRVVALGNGSEALLVVGRNIWVGNALDGTISIVDPGANKVLATVDEVCDFPISLGAGDAGPVWIACFASAELVAIDRSTFAVERRVDLDDPPLNLLLHPERDLAYVSLPRQNAIAEIDLHSGREVRRIRVGIEPDGLRWAGFD